MNTGRTFAWHSGDRIVVALSRAVAANRQAAARFVVVDAVDEHAASFYEHFGFERIPARPNRLIQKMSSTKAALGGSQEEI